MKSFKDFLRDNVTNESNNGKIMPQAFNHLKKEPLPAPVGNIKQECDPLKKEPENGASREAQKAHGKECEHFKDKKTLGDIGLSPKKVY